MSIELVCVMRPTRRHLGAIRARLGPVGGALLKFWGFETIMRQYEYELICFRAVFCFVNISAPLYRTETVLYSRFLYGSQFSGEKSDMKIRYLVAEILSKNRVSFFLGHPVYYRHLSKMMLTYSFLLSLLSCLSMAAHNKTEGVRGGKVFSLFRFVNIRYYRSLHFTCFPALCSSLMRLVLQHQEPTAMGRWYFITDRWQMIFPHC